MGPREREAGREMDAEIAEKVMGWSWDGDGAARMLAPPEGDPRRVWAAEWDEQGIPDYLPRYSTDIAAAWEVVERMSATTKEHWDLHVFSTGYSARFWYEGGRDVPWAPGEYEADGFTMPEAICLAALNAVAPTPEADRAEP